MMVCQEHQRQVCSEINTKLFHLLGTSFVKPVCVTVCQQLHQMYRWHPQPRLQFITSILYMYSAVQCYQSLVMVGLI